MSTKHTGIPGAVFMLLCLAGCASTQVAGFTDPDYSGRSFAHPAVVVGAVNLLRRQELEKAMVEKLQLLKIPAESTLDLCPPTRDLTPEERNAILTQHGVDALIVIVVDQEGVEKSYIPVYATTTESSGSVSTYGNATVYKETSTTQVHGGYETTKPWAQMTTKLVDTGNGRTAWIAGSATEGTMYATFDTVYNSYFISVLKEMVKQRMLHTTEKLSVLTDYPRKPPSIGGR